MRTLHVVEERRGDWSVVSSERGSVPWRERVRRTDPDTITTLPTTGDNNPASLQA